MEGTAEALGSHKHVHEAAHLIRAVWEWEAQLRGAWSLPEAEVDADEIEEARPDFARLHSDSTDATFSRTTSALERNSMHSVSVEKAEKAYLRDWAGVQSRLDPRGTGKVEIDLWLDLVTHAIFGHTLPSRAGSGASRAPHDAKTSVDRSAGLFSSHTAPGSQAHSKDGSSHGWEMLVLYVWFAMDHREAGELQTSSYIAWLRRLAAAPDCPMARISDVYAGIDRGWKTMRSRSAMPQSYLTRLTKLSAAQEVHTEVDDSAKSADDGREEELESIPTSWASFKQVESEVPIWTVTQVRGKNGEVVAGPFKSYGRHRKLTVENTSAKERNWWVGVDRLTDHTHITDYSFPHDVEGVFEKGYKGHTNDEKLMLTGTPVSEPDGIKTVACLHFHTTAKEEDTALGRRRTAPTEIIDLACVLVNRNTCVIVDEWFSYVNPNHTQSFSRLSYATTSANLDQVKSQDGFADVWQRFEEWLISRNVLETGKKCHAGNPTVFVVENSDQLAATLPLQLQQAEQALPVYLESWLDLNSVFKRHFRCGTCSGCSTRVAGACKTRFTVPEMVRVMRSKHWDEFMERCKTKASGDDAEIDLMIYGVESGCCFDSAEDEVHKEYSSKNDRCLTKLSGPLYRFKQNYSGEDGSTATDLLLDWQLSVFRSNGCDLSFVQNLKDMGGIECRLLKLNQIRSISPIQTRAQEHAFEIEYVNDENSAGKVLLAAETSVDCKRWIHGLCVAAGIGQDGTDCAMQAPHNSQKFSAHEKAQVQLLVDSGHDQDIARAILEEEMSSVYEMETLLGDLGIPSDIAARCAQGVSGAFQSFRTGCSAPAAAGLQYCREMAILMQALISCGADLKCTDGLSWYSLDLKQNSFDSTLAESLDTVAAARRRAVKTRGHQAQDLSAMTTLKPCRKVSVTQKHDTKGNSTFSRAYS